MLSILGILSIVISVKATPGEWLSHEVLDESEIHRATKEACAPLKSRDLYGGLKFDQLYAGIFPSDRFNRLIHSIFSEEFQKNTVYILDDSENENELWLLGSSAFNKALKECFSNKSDQMQFKKLVSLRKRAGYSLGLAISLLGVWKGTNIAARFFPRFVKYFDKSILAAGQGYLTLESLSKLVNKAKIRIRCGKTPRLDCILSVLDSEDLDEFGSQTEDSWSSVPFEGVP